MAVRLTPHQVAIKKYRKWLRENPEARKRERIRMFDRFVDVERERHA